jgi:serine/threonine-protein kinase HipA
MNSKSWETTVFVYLPGETNAVPAGKLAMLEEGARVTASTFGYGRLYLERSKAIPVDPVSLPLTGAKPGTERLYEPCNGLELFGAVRDAMPDAWGRRVIENKLKAEPNSLKESEYLLHAGSNRLGALDFRMSPSAGENIGLMPDVVDLPYLLDAADRVQCHEQLPVHLRQLLDAGSSMGGARPKAVVAKGGNIWLAKFPAQGDAFSVPKIEQACLELARECGLNVPNTELVTLPGGRQVMLIERFDRVAQQDGNLSRRHVVSALTLLGLHESESPTASYAGIARKLSEFGASGFVQSDREELFGRMVFNILVGNDDDHLRNHAFVWDERARGWRLSPLYDVLPKPQMAQERYLHLGVGERGRLATLDNALSHAGQFGLHPPNASAIIDRIARQVREWRTFFEAKMGIPVLECDKVASAFRKPKDIGWD